VLVWNRENKEKYTKAKYDAKNPDAWNMFMWNKENEKKIYQSKTSSKTSYQAKYDALESMK